MISKKRLIIMLIMLSLVTTSVTFSYWASEILGSSTNSTSNITIGNWVEDGFIPIFNEDDFIQQVEGHTASTKIVLMKDVEINRTEPLQEFFGTLDGNGYTIKNNSPISSSVVIDNGIATGLFSKIRAGAKVSNLILDGIVINANFTGGTNSYAATLAAYNEGLVENVAVKGGSVTATHTHNSSVWVHASGLVGENKGTVKNSYSTTNVTLTVNKTSSSTGTIYGYAGGLVGKNVGGTVQHSYATGTIRGYGSNAQSSNSSRYVDIYAGGIVGNADGGTVSETFATGTVSAQKSTSNGRVRVYAGRIVGNNSGTINSNRYLQGQSVTVSSNSAYNGSDGLFTGNSQGTLAIISNLYNLSGTGLSNWERTIWKINTNAYPTLLMEDQ